MREAAEDAIPDAPQAVEYGALCFLKGKRASVGIAPYTNHVSLIFDRGAEMEDPAGVLEGTGALRRHITIRDKSEIAGLPVEEYVGEGYRLE
ncbi:DUF1801 domain-containing protein [Rubrivirga litoralis]|uniref:DUF1801 domain-containing protein n=1 Tax=Rubrivirga litoralis TaxID=3075598 RepID=A0ABU3BQR7_9BACT|nr:DUF1801 domain-containing protein [Rubrivirga sp. F394]MDT0631634.1 DUF1801 domain-containing protein [Rubrivirga sp. F394]